MCAGLFAHVIAVVAYRDQKRASDPMKQDSQAVVSLSRGVLGTELRSFARAVSTLHCELTSELHSVVYLPVS